MAGGARILVVLPSTLDSEFVDAVRAVDPRVDVLQVTPEGPLPAEVADAKVFFRSYGFGREMTDAVVELAKGLAWMHVPAAGVDPALTPRVMESSFAITNVAGVYDAPVAELSLALMLAAAKRLPAYFAAQQDGRWLRGASWDEVKQERTLPSLLRGATATVLGFGGTGGALAEMLKPLGMRVVGWRRDPKPDPRAEVMYGPGQLHEALGPADYVVATLPLTRETERIIGERELAAMKPTAWLVNVGRGGLVDDDALVAALQSGRIAGACLDVFTREPLPGDHPYYRLPNVILTPHIAGAFPELNDIDREYFVAQLRRFVQGEPLKATIGRQRGY
jgi:phosphoglycerate dehydrogenase-like enzyme